MTSKEREAMQKALEALEACVEKFYAMKSTGVIGAVPMQAVKAAQVITTLREALDHSGESDEMVIGWDRVKPEAIASDPLYQQGFVDGVEEGRNQVAEQSEQEPVADIVYDEFGPRIILRKSIKELPDGMQLFTAPVRTKDLTDDELSKLHSLTGLKAKQLNSFARAVIAADREKNK